MKFFSFWILLGFSFLLSSCSSAQDDPATSEPGATIARAEYFYNQHDYWHANVIVNLARENYDLAEIGLRLSIKGKNQRKPKFWLDIMQRNSRSGSADRYRVQLYEEYVNYKEGRLFPEQGECPASFNKSGCECRGSALQRHFSSGAEFSDSNPQEFESAAWFSEAIMSKCPSPETLAIELAAIAQEDSKKATELLGRAPSKEVVDRLCRLREDFVNFPETSGISKLEASGSLLCPSMQ